MLKRKQSRSLAQLNPRRIETLVGPADRNIPLLGRLVLARTGFPSSAGKPAEGQVLNQRKSFRFRLGMNQESINQAEWENHDNWTGPKWLSVYFSKRDSRVWVPKQIPTLGWTINLGRPAGVAWLVAIIIGLPLFVIGLVR